MNWRGGIIQSSSRCQSALASLNLSGDILSQLTLAATKMKGLIKITSLLAIVAVCLFGCVLNSQSGIFREFQAVLLSVEWMLLVCIAVWCGTFLFLDFSLNDLPLIGLLLIAIAAYFIGYVASSRATDAAILLAGVTLGKGMRFALESGKRKAESGKGLEVSSQWSVVSSFLNGLVLLLAFASWWHLDMSNNIYRGPRWMGLWDNPNDYGILIGAGVTLAMGLLAAKRKAEIEKRKPAVSSQQSVVGSQKSLRSFAAVKSAIRNPQSAILLVAAGMMGVGLVMSYSRGAWLGTAIGLLYLAKAHGKLKWRFVLPGIFVVAAVAWFFWSSTPDTAPWFVKRMDLGRPSAQHRVAAWKAGFEIMRDHPFGVGWNNAEEIYRKQYSPPENGAAAITTNDYLMLGTQLGLPGLLCFVGYIWLCFRGSRPYLPHPQPLSNPIREGSVSPPAGSGEGITASPVTCHSSLRAACRAGALAILVTFWFDGGLFKLATASVFWILLELSQIRNTECRIQSQTDSSLVSSASTESKV